MRRSGPALDHGARYEGPDPVVRARGLLAVADGLTLRFLVGSLTAEEAVKSLRVAVDGTIGL